MSNKQDGLLILHDRTEKDSDSSGQFLIEHALDGQTYRISSKRKHLWGIFESANRFEPLLLTIESFTKDNDTIQYVSNAQSVAKTLNDRILESGIKNLLQKVVDISNDERIRGQAISYAKDLKCSNATEDMYGEAEKIFNFIKGIKDEEVNGTGDKRREKKTKADANSRNE